MSPHTRPDDEILIIAASARAAAQSAASAGLRVTAIDLFGDTDLCRVCESHIVRHWPQAIASACRSISPTNWMYGGGLENHPELIAEISRKHRLMGNDSGSVKGVRDPMQLSAELTSAGFRMPETLANLEPTEAKDENWLAKPLRSAGGLGVRQAEPSDVGASRASNRNKRNVSATRKPSHYFQREVSGGCALAAVYFASPSETTLWGVTRQLLRSDVASKANGVGECASPERFVYCGSLGPIQLPNQTHRELLRLGRFLTARYGLRGIFGVDFVLVRNAVWVIEVNPRFPASAEILEHATGKSAIGGHLAACRNKPSLLNSPKSQLSRRDGSAVPAASDYLAKLILFADAPTVIDQEVHNRLMASSATYADIPQAETSIGKGRPMFTVFANGESEDQVYEKLLSVASHARQLVADCKRSHA